MQNKGTGRNSSKSGPQNTRVYAPTHRTGASPAAGAGQASGLRQASKAQANGSGVWQPTGKKASASEEYAPSRRKPADVRPGAPIQKQDRTYAPSRAHQETPQHPPQNTAYTPQRRQNATIGKQHGGYEVRQKANVNPNKAAVRPPQRSRKKEGQAGTYSSIHRLESISAAQQAQERELARAKKKEKKKLKKPLDPKKLLTYGIIGVSSVALLLLGYFLFLVQTVEVDGNETYADESIVELSALQKGTHMLLCDAAQVKVNIEKNPYLQVKSVAKELPGTIRITVSERREVAAIQSQDYDIIIDETGHVLSIGKGSDLSSLLLVSGMSNIGFEVNEQIGTKTDLQTQTLLSLMKELKNLDLLKDVSRADLSNPLNVCLYTTENITVMLGQTDGLEEKLTWMRDALPSLRVSGVEDGVLDVSAKGGAIYSPPKAEVTPAITPDSPETAGQPTPPPAGAENSPVPEHSEQPTPPPEETPNGENT